MDIENKKTALTMRFMTNKPQNVGMYVFFISYLQ